MPQRPAAMPRPTTLRARQLAVIHTLRADLALDDDAYRGLLRDWTGKTTAADLRSDERDVVVARLRLLQTERTGAVARAADDDPPHVRRVKALWRDLARLRGTPADLAGLNAEVRRTAGVDHVHWLTPEAAAVVAAALKDWLDRVQGPRRRRA